MTTLRREIGLGLGFLLLLASAGVGQENLPPDEGGTIVSMGQPPIFKPYIGPSAGGYWRGDASDFTAYLNLGVLYDLISPVTGAGAVVVEGYGGIRGNEFDGGARFLYAIPFFRLALGVNWDFRDNRAPFMLRIVNPLFRGGFLARGGMVALDWLPSASAFNVGLQVPLGQPWAGKTRPPSMKYRVSGDQSDVPVVQYADPNLDAVLANVREGAYWINWFTVPPFDQSGRRRDQAVAAFTADMQHMQSRLASTNALSGGPNTAGAEVLTYHAEVARAFSIALTGEAHPLGIATPEGELIAARARLILLDKVLIPYNSMLGVKKKKDTTRSLAKGAMAEFTEWASGNAAVPAARLTGVQYVFQTILDAVEDARAQSKEWWDDDRIVWLPLQYALLPEEHDTQAELDALIEQLTGHLFTDGNRVSYALGLQFQWELFDGVRKAEDYHVLWIHDYRGVNKSGDPDLIAFYQTRNYIRTLTERVRAYEEVGRLPTYFLFMDQHYYEINKAKRWVNVMERPMDRRLKVPDDFEWMADSLEMAQAELRAAVDGSERLQADARRYGEDWLANRIKVQVSITNPADLSYAGNSLFATAGWPDNIIRDHRKIIFYDITEEDPYKGAAVYSGMGIGEHYVGPNWEDRAAVLSGPAALDLKYAARDMLLSQGFKEDQIPEPLRPKPLADDYAERVAEAIVQLEGGARAMQLHAETGYLPKPITVMKAVLYTLMPPGTVIIDPDSLWHNPLWSSMITGSCLRGVRAIIIHPSQANAPGQAFFTLGRANEAFERLIIAQQTLAAELDTAGGLLRTGLYHTSLGTGNLAGRVQQVADGFRSTPWLRELLPVSPELMAALDDAEQIFEEATGGREVEYLADELKGVRRPMLHLKTNFAMTGEVLNILLRSPEFAVFARQFIAQRSLDVVTRSEYRDVRELNLTLFEPFMQLSRNLREEYGQDLEERSAGYFVVGSSNQDPRSALLDGEVALVMAGRATMNGFFDSIGIAGGAVYVYTVEELNEYLPYLTGIKWKFSRYIKVLL